jgi:hypothetical protein
VLENADALVFANAAHGTRGGVYYGSHLSEIDLKTNETDDPNGNFVFRCYRFAPDSREIDGRL